LATELFNLGTPENPVAFTFSSILFLLIVFVIARFVVTLFRIFIHRSTKTRAWIDEGRRYTFIQLTKYFVYTIAITIAIQGLGVDITLLIYGSTALFVGIGLGLQSVLGDMFSGIILLFDGSIKVGDIVELSENEIAKVQNIYIRTSQLKTLDGKFVIVPNSKLTKDNVTNLTISDKATRFHVKVAVAYGTDTKKLKEILYECALQHPLVEKTRNIIVLFDDFGDYALNFRVYFWVKRTWEILNIKSDIRYVIDQRFRENGIKIPFPQRDIHLMDDRLKNSEGNVDDNDIQLNG
jgi:small-conductance mechanosensitive channel